MEWLILVGLGAVLLFVVIVRLAGGRLYDVFKLGCLIAGFGAALLMLALLLSSKR
ncbi:hypothetical protein JXD38_04995 [candidate division WOR-3 bacterium]|nr:hypothetical protein [candidate division WOR-3 bacterium]